MLSKSANGSASSPAQSGVHPPAESFNTKHMRKVLASSFIGSVIEYYDFLLYATAAALVFGPVFFSNLSPAVATFASFGTLAVGYLARPLGGALFGHFGDRVGRKHVLVISMLTMGIATTCIGLLPPTAKIGVMAPILMVLLRMVQGVAVGGVGRRHARRTRARTGKTPRVRRQLREHGRAGGHHAGNLGGQRGDLAAR